MTQGFLRRTDVGYPPQPNPRALYGVKHLENIDPDVLENEINAYILSLPEITDRWVPHLVETQYYVTGSGVNLRHHCWLTVYATGTLSTSPF